MRNKKSPKGTPLTERVARYSATDSSGCVLWSGQIDACGYGRLQVDGLSRLAHRVAWELVNGPTPDGLCVCHRCDVRNCVLVDHLFLGSNADNMRDMAHKGRANNRAAILVMRAHPERRARGDRSGARLHPEKFRGENAGSAKLTENQVREIRRLAESGVTRKDISSMFGVNPSNISHIVLRRNWAHVA
jgi:hypothetical protein